ncbi:MAG: hypothetical protein GXP38_14730 [Chloroflexi bacterium]|nr:hypothetical protein [Chloroflexota bacterium]
MMTPSPTPPTGDETSAPTATPEQHPRGGGGMMTPSPTPPTGDETPVPTPTPQHHPRRGMN